jgi:hypothetical protein
MMHHAKLLSKLFILVLFMVVAGCATQPIAVPTISTPPPVSIPVPTPTNLQNMKYQLITAQTLPTLVAAFQANPNLQYYVLDRTNMEIMISNVQELRRYILEEQTTINYLAGVLKSQQDQGTKATATGDLVSGTSNLVTKIEKK